MPTFAFTARDSSGTARRGTTEGVSLNAVVEDLRRRDLLVLDVRPVRERTALELSVLRRMNPLRWLPPRSLDIELSLQQMAVMFRSGLPLLSAIRQVAAQCRRARLASVWRNVGERIEEGASMAEALREHRCFGDLVIHLVRVGEETGNLDVVLTRAAEVMEARRRLRTDLITALMYPAIVVVMALGVAGFMVGFVMPQFQTFLAATGKRLPAMAQMLLDVSSAVQNYWLPACIGIVALLPALTATYLWPPGRLLIDRLILHVPVIGVLFRLSGTEMFARGLSILVSSGVQLISGLKTVEGLMRNRFLAMRTAIARQHVAQGEPLAESLTEGGGFVPLLGSMIAIGEASGTLDNALEETARFTEAQLQGMIRRFSAIVEPVIIVVVGGIVGFVYISFFLALFAAYGAFK